MITEKRENSLGVRGERMGKCKGVVGEIAVVGVRTRARAAMAMAAVTSSTSTLPLKKIKKAAASTTPYNVHEMRSRRRGMLPLEENSASSSPRFRPDTTTTSSDVAVVEALANCSGGEVSSDFPASCCSSNNASSAKEVLKDRFEIIADPEQVESAQTSSRHLDRRSEARGESKVIAAEADNLDSPMRLPDVKSTVHIKMPSDSEIEEFFTAAEKDLQKRFTDKYNFDVVNDVAMEGRYEWVQIKP